MSIINWIRDTVYVVIDMGMIATLSTSDRLESCYFFSRKQEATHWAQQMCERDAIIEVSEEWETYKLHGDKPIKLKVRDNALDHFDPKYDLNDNTLIEVWGRQIRSIDPSQFQYSEDKERGYTRTFICKYAVMKSTVQPNVSW